jgi:DNA-binding NarL/FixJ family response regulator
VGVDEVTLTLADESPVASLADYQLERKTKVLLCDGQALMLVGVRQVLEQAEGFDVVGEARVGSEVLPLIGRTNPDVVLLDMRMPGIDGLGCLDRIRLRHPNVKVVIFSVSTNTEPIQAALARGASGYIVKNINPLDLPSALRQAVEGTVYHALGLPELNDTSIAKAAGLTERELTIIKAVARGLSNQAIAKELWVTEQTVKFHLTNIYRKLDISNRTEAARWAYAQGFMEAPWSEGAALEGATT